MKNFKIKNINYLYYLIGEGISKGTIFLLLSFFTNYFNKDDFGKLSLIWVSIPLFSILIDYSQRSYIKHYYLHNNAAKTLKLIRSIYFFSIVSGAVLFCFFLLKKYFNVFIVDFEHDYFIISCSLFFALIELHLSYYQIRGEAIKYNVIFLIRNSLPYILTATILFCFSGEVMLFLQIHLILLVGLVIYLSYRLFRNAQKPLFNIKDIKTSLNFSFPFIPAMLSVLALSFSDRFIIKYYFSEEEVANYTVAYTVCSIFIAFFLATNKMWQKFMLESLKENKLNKIRKTTFKYVLIVATVGITIILIRGFLVNFFSNSSYILILDIIPTIIIGMFFYFLYTVLSNIPFFYKNTFLMALPAIIAATINIILNFVFIPKLGYKIAALTTAISYLVEFLVIYIICLRKYKIDILFHGITKKIIGENT